MASSTKPEIKLPDYSGEAFRVADMTQADFGRKELDIAEQEMPGLMADPERNTAQTSLSPEPASPARST